jgi:hypothetical protein
VEENARRRGVAGAGTRIQGVQYSCRDRQNEAKYNFMVFDVVFGFFTLFCCNINYIQLHLLLRRYSLCEAIKQM